MKTSPFKNIYLFYTQLFMSLLGLFLLIWRAGDLLKKYVVANTSYGIKEWAALFYHPYEANLLNYMLFSVVIGLAALIVYCLPADHLKRIDAAVEGVSKRIVYYLLGVSFILVIVSVPAFRSQKSLIPACLLVLSPVGYFIPELYLTKVLFPAVALYYLLGVSFILVIVSIPAFLLVLSPVGYFIPELYLKKVLFPAVALLFLFVSLEPVRLFLGPAKLMNEYPELLSETLVNGQYVRNDIFLSAVPASPNNVVATKFVADNTFERIHQVMGRGQMNHVGHVLNTAHEYSLGKPLSSIFMQYGVGNTLLLKWTMDLFGGVTFQNYYKCCIYYPVYYFIFLLMLLFVLKDSLSVFLGFSAVACMYFVYNYIPLFFAPGLIPTIHFFDVFLVFSMSAFLRGKAQRLSLLCSLIFASLGILLNRQFGSMLALAWIVTLAVYALENCRDNKKYLGLILPIVLLCPVFVFATKFAGTTSEGMLRTFFSGLYSWPPHPNFVIFTIVYFILSYYFLIMIKAARSHYKYLYLFSFIYSQGLFVYFYWAGLANHFPIVIPVIMFQLLLAMKIMESMENAPLWGKAVLNLKLVLLIAAVYSVAIYAADFYTSPFGERTVSANFTAHRSFEWKFKNANLISTINPAIFEDAAKLINKYADSRGIYIISKFDAILPFVSDRYSMMPHVELNWFVIDDDKCAQVIRKFREDAPRYIFADSDLNSLGKDPMSVMDVDWAKVERTSRLGRLDELKNIFNEVSKNYRLVEKGALVSVYEKVS